MIENRINDNRTGNIKVSICCLAYNHEKYIRQCLDGFLMQETDFAYEVIVHDDASTDGTTEIIKEYAEKYPDIIKPIFQINNQYSRSTMPKIYRDYLYPKARGKYIAYCEGDDFWCSKNKLYKQVKILDDNPDCHMCTHRVQHVDESGKPFDSMQAGYPERLMETGRYSSFDFMKELTEGCFFHTTSFMCRADDLKSLINESPKYYYISDLDDVPLLLYMGQLGCNYYLSETLSCYRKNSIGSWTNSQGKDSEKKISHKELNIEMYKLYDQYTNMKYHDLVEHWINNEKFMIAELKRDFREMSKRKYREFMRKRSFVWKIKVYCAGIVGI